MEALHQAIDDGTSFSLPTMLELETAELLVDVLGNHVPSWSPDDIQVRFTKTGTECTTAAVRLARAVTGRDSLLRCKDSYLGWGDTFIATTPPAFGIPKAYAYDIELFEFGKRVDNLTLNWDATKKLIKSAFLRELDESEKNTYMPSAVVLEQGIIDPPAGWYDSLRKWCDEYGALLILDETASGFRYGLGGAAERFGIKPDLACYGKALGNGVAISALVGRREHMQWFARNDPVFVSGTFFGETLGLAGAKATLEFMLKNDVIGHLSKIGGALQAGLTDAFKDTPVSVIGHDVRHILKWPNTPEGDQWHAHICREMAKRGILMNRPNLGTWSHTMEDVEKTVQAAQEIVIDVKKNGLPEYLDEQRPWVLFRSR